MKIKRVLVFLLLAFPVSFAVQNEAAMLLSAREQSTVGCMDLVGFCLSDPPPAAAW